MDNLERATKIRGIMERKKITGIALAKSTKLHRNTISNLLDGKHSIGMATLQKVAAKLGVSIKTLA